MLEDSIIHLLHRASQVAEAHYAREQGHIDITPRQFVVMAAIDEEENQSQTRLVERCGVDRSTMTNVIGRLAEYGLVQRRHSKTDARAFRIRLTGLGKQLLQEAFALARTAEDKATERLDVCSRDELVTALKQIIASFEADNISRLNRT